MLCNEAKGNKEFNGLVGLISDNCFGDFTVLGRNVVLVGLVGLG